MTHASIATPNMATSPIMDPKKGMMSATTPRGLPTSVMPNTINTKPVSRKTHATNCDEERIAFGLIGIAWGLHGHCTRIAWGCYMDCMASAQCYRR